MAGSDPRFPRQKVRDGLLFAMQMGAPNNVNERVTFKWVTAREFSSQDPAGRPYAWNATPVSEESHADVQVDCAVEFESRPAGSRDTPFGQFDTSRAIVTMMGEEYELIKDSDYVVIRGSDYDWSFPGPTLGLFDIDVIQIYCEARDLGKHEP